MSRSRVLSLLVCAAALASFIATASAYADNGPPAPRADYYRKFPWGPDAWRQLACGYYGDPYCGHSNDPKHLYALDFRMYKESVFVATESVVDQFGCDGGCAADYCLPYSAYLGQYVITRWWDGARTRYVTYAHLNQRYSGLAVGQQLAQGDYPASQGTRVTREAPRDRAATASITCTTTSRPRRDRAPVCFQNPSTARRTSARPPRRPTSRTTSGSASSPISATAATCTANTGTRATGRPRTRPA